MKRRTRRNKRNKQRNIIIVSVVCLTFTLVTAYSAFSTKLSITAKGNTIDRSRTIQSWTGTSNEDFHTTHYKENIVTATFLDTAKVPENAVEDWDVSVNKDRGVMAYVTESQTETGKYDLFIGAKDGVIANENSNNIFFTFTNLTTINFNNNFNTSNVINMTGMFQDCHSLKEIDLSSFDTSKVTSMHALFSMWHARETTTALTKINLTGFDTSNVTNMRDIFAYNPNLVEIIGLNDFDTSNVTNMQGMFINDRSLTELDLSSFNTNKVTNMWQTFTNCNSLTELNLCSFNTLAVTDARSLFAGTTNITKIKVGPNWNIANADTTDIFKESAVSNVTTGEC